MISRDWRETESAIRGGMGESSIRYCGYLNVAIISEWKLAGVA